MQRGDLIVRRGRAGRALALLLVALTLVPAAGLAVGLTHDHGSQHDQSDCGLCRVGHAPFVAMAPMQLAPPEPLFETPPHAPTPRALQRADLPAPARGPPA